MNPSRSLPHALLLAALFATSAPAADPTPVADQPYPIRMVVTIPLMTNNDQRTLKNDKPGYHFDVVIENVSSKPILLDYFTTLNLYLEVTDENGKTNRVERGVGISSAGPGPFSYAEKLGPGEMTVVEIWYVSDENGPYTAIPFPPKGKSAVVTIRAVMEESVDKALSAKLAAKGFWLGKAVSASCKVKLVGGK